MTKINIPPFPFRSMIFHVLLSLFTLAFFIEAHATIRYVSKTGNSTPPYLTWETASDSIQKCINIAEDADTILVGNGTYKETLAIDKAILLLGSSMDSTIIDGTNLNGLYNNITIEILAYVEIKNFKIMGKNLFPPTVIINTGYENILIIDNCRLLYSDVGIRIGFNSAKVKNSIFKAISHCAIFISGSDSCKPIVDNCIIVMPPNSGHGIYNDWGGNIMVTNNIVLMKNSYWSGIKCAGINPSINISNNFVYGAYESNIKTSYGAMDSGKIHNNIVIGGARGIDASINNMSIRNNIIMNNYVGLKMWGTTLNSDYNLFWNNLLNIQGGTVTGQMDIEADPMFVNDSIDLFYLNFDLHLQKFSPAIDAGDPSIRDIDGSISDLGMFGGPLGERYPYVDLAPRPPVNLTGSVDSGMIKLQWNRNTEADFRMYRLFRDTSANFIIDSTKLISEQSDTFYTQTVPAGINKFYYKLTAVDSQGNESLSGEEIGIMIVGMDEKWEVIDNYYLYQNYPNPFNPSTKIGYKLKERGYVKLMLYDIKGELIKVLINKEIEAGYYEETLDFTELNLSSGIYLYRIEVIGEGKIPVFMDMKKMMLVK